MCLLALTASARRGTKRMSYDGSLRRGLHVGIQGSVNSTWIINQNNYNTLDLFYIPIVRQSEMDYVFTWGGQLGAEVGYNFHKHWGIEFQPSFSWSGQSYDDAFVGPVAAIKAPNGNYIPDGDPDHVPYFSNDYHYVHVKREIKFTYVQFPIYLKYMTHLGDIANYYVMIGPQINARQKASETVWVKDYVYPDPNRISADDKFQKIDIGIGGSTGVEIYTSPWMYFNIGLTTFGALNDLNGDILKNLGWYDKNHVDYQSSHNFYIGFNAGLHFYFKTAAYY